jgi:hypothetical protein
VIEVDSTLALTWLDIAMSAVDMRGVDLRPGDLRMDIVRKGQERVLAAYYAFTKNAEGQIGFYWDDAVRRLPHGWYTGDVYVSTEYCFSMALRVRRCMVEVVACETESVGKDGCGYDVCSPLGLIGC